MHVPGRALGLVGLGLVGNPPAQRNRVLVDRQVQIVRLHARDCGQDDCLIPGRVDVERHRLRGRSATAVAGPNGAEGIAADALVDETVDGVTQGEHVSKKWVSEHSSLPPSLNPKSPNRTTVATRPIRHHASYSLRFCCQESYAIRVNISFHSVGVCDN